MTEREPYDPWTCPVTKLVDEFFHAVQVHYQEKARMLFIIIVQRLARHVP